MQGFRRNMDKIDPLFFQTKALRVPVVGVDTFSDMLSLIKLRITRRWD